MIVIPAVELYLLVVLGRYIGVLATVALIVVTGILGAKLAHSQGISLLFNIRRQLNEGKIPATEMAEGVCVLAAGLVLLTPGFLTDLLGFLLLIPVARRWIARKVYTVLKAQVRTVHFTGDGFTRSSSYRHQDGEVHTGWRKVSGDE